MRKRILRRIITTILTLGMVLGDIAPVYAAGEITNETVDEAADETIGEEETTAVSENETEDGDEEVNEEPDAAAATWVHLAHISKMEESSICPEDGNQSAGQLVALIGIMAELYVWTDQDLSKPVIKTTGPNKTYNLCPAIQDISRNPQNYRYKLVLSSGGGISGQGTSLNLSDLRGFLWNSYDYKNSEGKLRNYYRYFTNLNNFYGSGCYGKLSEFIPYVSEVSLENSGISPITELKTTFQSFSNLTTFSAADTKIIPQNCFSGCSNLTTVTFADGASSASEAGCVPAGAFYGCSKLISAKAGANELKTYSHYEANAFNGCKSYFSGAFDSRGKVIGATALANCSISSVTTNNNTEWANYAGNPINTITITSATSLSNTFSSLASTLKTINAENATSITSSFSGLNALTTLNAPKLTSVCENAFKNCTSLSSIPMTGLTSVADSAFYGCTALTSADLRAATSIGANAFSGCVNIGTVYVDNVTSFGDSAFDNCSKISVLNISKATTIGQRAFYGLSNLSGITITNASSIGSYAFYGSGITSLNIPTGKNITIGTGAFAGGKLSTVIYDDYEENFNSKVALGGSRSEVFGTAAFQFKAKPTPSPTKEPTPTPKPGDPTPTPKPDKPTPTPAQPTPIPSEPNIVYHTVNYTYENKTIYTERVVEGGTAQFTPEVTRENCTFIGWYAVDQNLVWNPSSPVYTDITVRAKFINNKTGETEPKDGGDPSDNPDDGKEPYDDLDDPELKENRDIYLVKGQKIRLMSSIAMSSDKKIVSVSKPKNGYITLTAKKSGSCQVMVTNSSGTTLTHVFYVDKPAISEKKLTMAVGQNKTLMATVGMWTTKYKIYWGSSNPDVAYVENGTVYGVGKGSATISAYINGKKYSSKVKVKEIVAPDNLSGHIELAPLQEIKLDGGGFKSKGAIWSFDTPNIVSVNGAKMVAVGCGTTSVTGHDINGNIRNFTVTVKPATPRIMHVNMGSSKTQQFYKVKAKDALWESSNPEIATVNAGKITGHKNGVTLITATYKGFINRVYVFVENPTLTPNDKLFINGKKYSLTVMAGTNTVLRSPTTYQSIFFTSKNPEIARVNQYGVVIPCSAGKTKLSAKVNGKTINVVVNVFESGTDPAAASAYANSDAAFEYDADTDYTDSFAVPCME